MKKIKRSKKIAYIARSVRITNNRVKMKSVKRMSGLIQISIRNTANLGSKDRKI